MELWIRSQDELKLVKVNYLYIMDQQDHYTIIGETIDSGPIIATYKTKERALEVLDEIQEYINNECEFLEREQYTSMGIYIKKEQMRVYEMPKE